MSRVSGRRHGSEFDPLEPVGVFIAPLCRIVRSKESRPGVVLKQLGITDITDGGGSRLVVMDGDLL